MSRPSRGSRATAAHALVVLAIVAASGPAEAPRPLVYGAAIPLLPLNAFANEWTEASAALLSRLYTIDREGRLAGDLVASHEVSPDGLTWTLRLRRDVEWHDGTRFSSADVTYTFDEMRKPGARARRWRDLDVIERYAPLGADTVVLHLKTPRPALPVPLVEVPILPRHVLSGHDPNDDRVFDRRPVGTGPYKLVGRTADGRLVFEAHASYHLGRPAIPRLEMVSIESDEARARAVVDGTVDVAHVKPQHMALVQASPIHELHRYPSGIWRSLVLNVRRPHLADRRVRQAIALALDRDAMVREGLLGVGTPAHSPIPPMNWAWSGASAAPRDVVRARALLDESGWVAGPDAWRRRDGAPLVLALAVWWTEPFRRAASDVVRRNLEEIGIQVRLVEIPGERYEAVAAALGPEHDAIISGYSGLLDPGDNLATKYRTGGSQNAGGYSNPDVDRLLDAAQREGDRARAGLLYQQALALIDADAARIPLVYVDYLFASRRDLLGMRGNVLDLYYLFPRLAYVLRWAP